MRLIITCFAIACCLTFAPAAQAIDYDVTKGEVLLRYAKVMKKSADNGGKAPESEDEFIICMAGTNFITGVIQGCQACQENYHVELPYSLPSNGSNQQLALVIEKYLNAHPEKLNLPSTALITFAFMEAFPNPNFKPQH